VHGRDRVSEPREDRASSRNIARTARLRVLARIVLIATSCSNARGRAAGSSTPMPPDLSS
jgi:hypothetical protein